MQKSVSFVSFIFSEEGKLFSPELFLQIWPQVSINFAKCYSSQSLCVLDKPTLPEPTSALWSVSVSVPRCVRAQKQEVSGLCGTCHRAFTCHGTS